MKGTKQAKYRFILESFLAIIIALSPLIFYSYKYFPSGTDKLRYIFFLISDGGWGDARTNLWFYLSKVIPLLLFIIWFATSKEWWYHAILIPISMYAFQLYTAVYSPTDTVDEGEIMYIVAVTMVIAPIVYFIRVKLIDKYVHGIDLKAMEDELGMYKEKEALQKELEKMEKRRQRLEKKEKAELH